MPFPSARRAHLLGRHVGRRAGLQPRGRGRGGGEGLGDPKVAHLSKGGCKRGKTFEISRHKFLVWQAADCGRLPFGIKGSLSSDGPRWPPPHAHLGAAVVQQHVLGLLRAQGGRERGWHQRAGLASSRPHHSLPNTCCLPPRAGCPAGCPACARAPGPGAPPLACPPRGRGGTPSRRRRPWRSPAPPTAAAAPAARAGCCAARRRRPACGRRAAAAAARGAVAPALRRRCCRARGRRARRRRCCWGRARTGAHAGSRPGGGSGSVGGLGTRSKLSQPRSNAGQTPVKCGQTHLRQLLQDADVGRRETGAKEAHDAGVLQAREHPAARGGVGAGGAAASRAMSNCLESRTRRAKSLWCSSGNDIPTRQAPKAPPDLLPNRPDRARADVAAQRRDCRRPARSGAAGAAAEAAATTGAAGAGRLRRRRRWRSRHRQARAGRCGLQCPGRSAAAAGAGPAAAGAAEEGALGGRPQRQRHDRHQLHSNQVAAPP
jgi:hypothetical protein